MPDANGVRVADQLRTKFPKPAKLMDEAETDVLAFMAFPKRTDCSSTQPTHSNV
jgi:putative transposase